MCFCVCVALQQWSIQNDDDDKAAEMSAELMNMDLFVVRVK